MTRPAEAIAAVGVVVPARDDQDHIGRCLDGVLTALPDGLADLLACL